MFLGWLKQLSPPFIYLFLAVLGFRCCTGFSLVAISGVYPQAIVQEQQFVPAPGFNPWVGKIPWRREWLPTPVFCPGESHRLHSPRGCQESDTTEQLLLTHSCFPGDTSGTDACLCRRHKRLGFDPWFRKTPWWREWQPTPVFLPGDSRGQRCLEGYSPLGRKESDTIEVTWHAPTCCP